MYYQDGTFYCADTEGYDCVQLYGLSEVVAVWDCQNEMPTIDTEQLFADYSWLNSLVDPNNCEGESLYVYTDGNFHFLFIEGDLYFQDGTYYCSNAMDYSCVNLYGLDLLAVWDCEGSDNSINEPCETETIMTCTGPIQPIEICIEPAFLCELETENYRIAEVVSTFNCSVNILNDTCFRYIPLPGFETVGEDIVIVAVCSNDVSNCETIYAMIEVGDCNTINPNLEPNAQNDSQQVLAGISTEVLILLNDYDIDGDELLFVNTAEDGIASNGSVVFNEDGTVTYTPNDGFVGWDAFSYTITDGNGGFDSGIVLIEVLEGNICSADFTICREPFPAPITEICIDFCTEGVVIVEEGIHPLFYECSINPISTNCFTYLPLPGFTGDEVIQIEACNPTTGDCELVYVGVTTSSDCLGDKPAPINEAPILEVDPTNDLVFNAIEKDAKERKIQTEKAEQTLNKTGEGIETLNASELVVYPNPSNGQVFIEINADLDFPQTINIYDLSGRSIMQKEVPANVLEASIELNLYDLPSGCYLVELQSQNNVSVQRLMLE